MTDLASNTRVKLPKALSARTEAHLNIRKEQFMNAFAEYKAGHCDSKGRQVKNLDVNQARGLKKILKRVGDGELMVSATDKTGRNAAIRTDIYTEMGTIHTKDDHPLSLENIRGIQRKLMGHCATWARFSSMGSAWGQEDRIKEAVVQSSCGSAPMYLLVKDHKSYDPSNPPPSRPVVASRNGMTHPLSNLISDFPEPIAQNIPGSAEVISTEDMLSKVDKLNKFLNSDYEHGQP